MARLAPADHVRDRSGVALPRVPVGRLHVALRRHICEGCRGRHILSQGGYYQYQLGFQGAFRDPLEQILPLIYADPSLARDVLLYSAQEQPRPGGLIPYAMSELCHKLKFGNADDLDLWLFWAAAEYGLGTRDLGVFDERVPYTGDGSGTLWEHLKLAFGHQQSLLRSHGGYAALDTRRLVGPLNAVPRHDGVHARHRPGRVRVPPPGGARAGPRRPRVRGGAPCGRSARAAHDARSVDHARLVRARVRRPA